MAQLLVTSTLPAGSLTVPQETEFVKLPSFRRVGRDWSGEPFVPLTLPIDFRELRKMRRDMLLAIARNFQPDVLLVDYMAAGLRGELVPTLRFLKRSSPCTRFVLGSRDILHGGAQLRRAWSLDGVYELLEEIYDLILVYGQPDVYDLVDQARLSQAVAAKVRYVGYLRREWRSRPPEQVRAELSLPTGRLVLVTVGGGGDGYATLHAVLQALRSRPAEIRFDCLVVAGPLMPVADRQRLRELLSPELPIRLLDSVADLVDLVAAADVVVARAGYNTVCEILSFARPAVLIPRATVDGQEVSSEQLLRAEALAQRGLARLIHPAELTAERLFGEINDLLVHPSRPPLSLRLEGLPAMAAQLETLLGRQPPAAPASAS